MIIGIVAVEVACSNANGFEMAVLVMALFALVDVGDHVFVGSLLAVCVNPLGLEDFACYFEGGIGLFFVPNIRQANPTIGAMNEEARFKEVLAFGSVTHVVGIGKCFGNDGAYGKVECLDGVVCGLGVFGQFDKSVFGGVVRKEWGVEVVRDDVWCGFLYGTCSLEEAVLG